jgi:class 3 adenylate cyclase
LPVGIREPFVTETAPRQTIRAIVASFLFTDLVGFSKTTAAEQYAAKANLSAILRRNLEALRESDYWIKDTGDGALIAFVSNPEHALYMALAIARDYRDAARADGAASKTLRTGLHLGTVKESIDLEARRDFIGDGINAAKRIMDFAVPGQITASGAFFDAIANLDAAYAALFQHLGAPGDKHGRAHELYALEPNAAVLDKLQTELAAERGGTAAPEARTPPATRTEAGALNPSLARILRPAPLSAIGLVVLLGIASAFFAAKQRDAAAPAVQPATSRPQPDQASHFDAAPPAAGNGAVAPKSTERAATATPAERANGASSDPGAAAAVPTSSSINVDAAEHRADVSQPAMTAPASTAKPLASAKARSAPPVASVQAGVSPEGVSPRCSRIVEKAALGEPLTQEEKRDLANSCR